jgi:hypothetical protein
LRHEAAKVKWLERGAVFLESAGRTERRRRFWIDDVFSSFHAGHAGESCVAPSSSPEFKTRVRWRIIMAGVSGWRNIR